MLRVKQCMGFLLVGTLLWLVWILGQMRGVDAIVRIGGDASADSDFGVDQRIILDAGIFVAFARFSRPPRCCVCSLLAAGRISICHQAEPAGLAAIQPSEAGRRAGIRQTGVHRLHRRLVYHLQNKRALRHRHLESEARICETQRA